MGALTFRPHPPKQVSRLFRKIDFYNDLEYICVYPCISVFVRFYLFISVYICVYLCLSVFICDIRIPKPFANGYTKFITLGGRLSFRFQLSHYLDLYTMYSIFIIHLIIDVHT